jgi:queuosine precursor transporter
MKLKYYDIIMALFVAVLLISNIASTKITTIWKFTFDAGTLLFPLSYIFGDVLTEVYGYARARKVIWVGFFSSAMLFLVLMIVSALPAAEDWTHQEAFQNILGLVPRIVIASMIAYIAGEFSNSYILAKMKIWTKGKMLWLRTIGSTLVGQGIDTIIFVSIAFYGIVPASVLWVMIISNYIIKCGLEIILTPATYKAVNFLKAEEGVDHYDRQTDFNPFSLRGNK